MCSESCVDPLLEVPDLPPSAPIDSVLTGVIQALHANPDDVYWGRRLLDLVRDPVLASRFRRQIVTAVRSWAKKDPSFFIHERYLSEQLAVWAWPRVVLEEIDHELDLGEVSELDDSLTHFIKGRLWLEARRPPEDMPEFYARAARHLRAVSPSLQVGVWHEALCEAIGVADPDELAKTAGAMLLSVAPAMRERVILAILRGAARTGNWALYDEHRRVYGALDPDASRMNSDIIRWDGLRVEHEVMQTADSRDLMGPRSPFSPPPPPSLRTLGRAMRSPRVFEAVTLVPRSRSRDKE